MIGGRAPRADARAARDRAASRASPRWAVAIPWLLALLALPGCSAADTSPPPDAGVGPVDALADQPGEPSEADAVDTGDSSSDAEMAATCPPAIPPNCPSPPPSFARSVLPILERSCTPCHAPGGVEEKRLLDDYAHVAPQRGSVLFQLAACRMPPAGAPPLLADGQQTLLAWLVCMAPDN